MLPPEHIFCLKLLRDFALNSKPSSKFSTSCCVTCFLLFPASSHTSAPALSDCSFRSFSSGSCHMVFEHVVPSVISMLLTLRLDRLLFRSQPNWMHPGKLTIYFGLGLSPPYMLYNHPTLSIQNYLIECMYLHELAWSSLQCLLFSASYSLWRRGMLDPQLLNISLPYKTTSFVRSEVLSIFVTSSIHWQNRCLIFD